MDATGNSKLFAVATSSDVVLDAMLLLTVFERKVVPPLLALLGIRKKDFRTYALHRLGWLDECAAGFVKTLAPAREGSSVGPMIKGVRASEPVVLPPVNLYRFDDALCCGVSSSVIHRGKVLLERAPGMDIDRVNLGGGNIRHGATLARVRKDRIERLEKGIFLGGLGSRNYYHWMIELLPKLMYLRDLEKEYGDYPLLVDRSAGGSPAAMEALDLLRGRFEVAMLDHAVTYRVGSLLHVTSPNWAPFNMRGRHAFRLSDFFVRRDAILYLRNELLSQTGTVASGGKTGLRLFLARSGKRRNYNQDEIFELFARHGFVEVFMEEQSLKDQMEMFHGAELLAGPSGAAWSNMIFCRPGTKGLCWMDERLSEFAAFSNLAECVGVDLRYASYHSRIRATKEFYSASYRLDPADVQCELAELLIDG